MDSRKFLLQTGREDMHSCFSMSICRKVKATSLAWIWTDPADSTFLTNNRYATRTSYPDFCLRTNTSQQYEHYQIGKYRREEDYITPIFHLKREFWPACLGNHHSKSWFYTELNIFSIYLCLVQELIRLSEGCIASACLILNASRSSK